MIMEKRHHISSCFRSDVFDLLETLDGVDEMEKIVGSSKNARETFRSFLTNPGNTECFEEFLDRDMTALFDGCEDIID